MHNKIVITHPEMGVYLGSLWGLGFWSKLDMAGQDSAAIFDDEADAREYVSTWDDNNDPNAYEYKPVSAASDFHATLEELREAGISIT